MYGYDEMLLAHHQRDEDRAEAEAEAHEARIDTWRTEFRAATAKVDINTESGIKALPKLIDVYDEATCESDQTVQHEAFRALLLLAKKGQIEAVEWLAKLEDRYVAFRETWA